MLCAGLRSFMKISQTGFELQSGHDFRVVKWTDGITGYPATFCVPGSNNNEKGKCNVLRHPCIVMVCKGNCQAQNG